MWMEEWVAEQNAADANRDRQLQRDRDARVDEHNRRTRQIAFGALILSGLSAVIASLTWIFPTQSPPVIVPPASVTFTAPSTSSVLPRSAPGDDAKTNGYDSVAIREALTRVGRPLPGTPENIAWLEERAFGKVPKQRAALASSERVEFATGFLAAQFIENARSRADVSLRERGKKRAR
jgi:hypothetical protein